MSDDDTSIAARVPREHRNEIEMVRTDTYERPDGRWDVVTTVGTPLVEIHVRRDVVESADP